MKGVIFNLLQDVVGRQFGEKTWEDLLDASHASGTYTSLGNYPDAEMIALVGAASKALGKPADEILRWFGTSALPLLAERYPIFFEGHTSTRAFLLTLNDVIHKEVRKLYPGADVPHFEYDTRSDRELVMTYTSARKLCALAEGFIASAAAHFGETATIRQSECMNAGAARCVFHLTFDKRAS